MTLNLLFDAGIDAVGEQLPGLQMALSGSSERHVRIDPERQGLVLTPEAEIEALVLAAIRHDVEIQAALVKELSRTLGGLCAAHLGIRQHVRVSPGSPELIPLQVPTRRRDCLRAYETTPDWKTLEIAGFSALPRRHEMPLEE